MRKKLQSSKRFNKGSSVGEEKYLIYMRKY